MRFCALRRIVPALFIMLTWLAAGSAPAQALPGGFESGVFSVRVGSLPASSMEVVVDSTGRVFLPVAPVLAAAGLDLVVTDSVSRIRTESPGAVRLDTTARRFVADSVVVGFTRSETVRSAGELYVLADRLAAVLGAHANVDWPGLQIGLTRPSAFPAEARLASAGRRGRLDPLRLPAYVLDPGAVPFRAGWGGLVADWDFSASSLDPRRSATLSPTLGTAVWGGDLRANGVLSTDARGRTLPARWALSYRRAFPTSRIVRQVEVGQFSGDGPAASTLRGIRIGNDPQTQEPVFGMVPLALHLPVGWEYEVYQNGRLVGVSDAIGEAAPPVLLGYGTNSVQVREIGPDGQETTRDLTFALPFTMAPRGALRYSAGLGQCVSARCTAAGFGTLRYGLTSSFTVGGGLGAPGADARYRPYAGLAFATRTGTSGEAQVERGGTGRLSMEFLAGEKVAVQASARVDALGGGTTGPATPRAWTTDASASVRVGSSGIQTLRLASRLEGQVGSGFERWYTSASAYHSHGTLEADVVTSREEPPAFSARGTQLIRMAHGAPISVSGAASLDGRGFLFSQAGATFTLAHRIEIAPGFRWDRAHAHVAATLGLSAAVGSAHVGTHLSSAPSDAAARSFLSAHGSLVLDRQGLAASGTRGAGAGGVAGRVFYDLDGDGRFSSGDSVAADQEIMVGGVAVRTDEHGRYARWTIAPYDVTTVRVDPTGLHNPSWSAASPERLIRLTPNHATAADFALQATKQLSGRVVGSAGAALGGVAVELRPAGHDSVAVTTTIYEDGAFYIARLRAGRYEMRVADRSLAAMRASGPTVLVDVPADASADEIQAPDLRLDAPDSTARPALQLEIGSYETEVRSTSIPTITPKPAPTASHESSNCSNVRRAHRRPHHHRLHHRRRAHRERRRAHRRTGGEHRLHAVHRRVLGRTSGGKHRSLERGSGLLRSRRTHRGTSSELQRRSRRPRTEPIGGVMPDTVRERCGASGGRVVGRK